MGTVWLLDQCTPQYGKLLMRIAVTFTGYGLKMTNLVYLMIEALRNSFYEEHKTIGGISTG